jgi:hypothetical protein
MLRFGIKMSSCNTNNNFFFGIRRVFKNFKFKMIHLPCYFVCVSRIKYVRDTLENDTRKIPISSVWSPLKDGIIDHQ